MVDPKPVLLLLPGIMPPVALEVLPRGLTIHKLILQVDARTHDIVIGPEKPEDHAAQKYINPVIGRYANRIPVGDHILERNGFKSVFVAQPNENPKVSLHGGPVGFDSVVWTVLPKTEAPQLFSASEFEQIKTIPDDGWAIFRLVSPAGDQGYPGELIMETLFALVCPEDSEKYNGETGKLGNVIVVYRAKLSKSETVTPVNLTQHWGFNLDASLREGPETLTVKNHELTIKADSIAERDKYSLPTYTYIPVSTLPAHDHDKKLIGDKFPDSGYDDYYRFNKSVVSPPPTRFPVTSLSSAELNLLEDILRQGNLQKQSNPAVQLSSLKSGVDLTFYTNQHGVMFYTNNNARPDIGARKRIHGGSGLLGQGDSYGPGTAAFLEFHDPLAAFLDPDKGEEDTLLTSNEVYHNFVRLEVRFTRPHTEENREFC